MKTEAEAKAIDKKTQKLLGPGWKSRIWENLGWHVSWHKGAVSLSYDEYSKRKGYSVLIGPIGRVGGHIDLTKREGRFHKTPQEAIQSACSYAQEVFETLWKPIINSVEEINRKVSQELPARNKICCRCQDQFRGNSSSILCPECLAKEGR